MTVDDNLSYEDFIRDAFSLRTGNPVGRHGDPARLANTDILDSKSLDKAKTGIAYAMSVFNTVLYNEVIEEQHEIVRPMMEDFLKRVLSATTTEELMKTVEAYKQDVLSKHLVKKRGLWYNVKNGLLYVSIQQSL